MFQLLQGPVSCIWHGSKVCAHFEREGTNWVASDAGGSVGSGESSWGLQAG